MVPLSDYATVSEDDTLANAVKALKQAQSDNKFLVKHRAVLAFDSNNRITGKLSIFDILKALEPKYRQFERSDQDGSVGLSRFGLNQEFLNSLLDHYDLWDESLEELVRKASDTKVKDVMYTPGSGEYVDADSPLAEAVHRFLLGCHQALLVLENDEVVGILRLTDLFELVSSMIE